MAQRTFRVDWAKCLLVDEYGIRAPSSHHLWDDPLPETRYNLSLEVNPEGAGSLAGAGEYDEFGFSALPGGSSSSPEQFFSLGTVGAWWSATEFPSDYGLPSAWVRVIAPKHGHVHHSYYPKSFGISLRCVRETVHVR